MNPENQPQTKPDQNQNFPPHAAVSATPPVAPSIPTPPATPPPMAKSIIDAPTPVAKKSYPWMKDLLGIFLFIAAVIIGAWLINTLVFRSFSVTGPSMEDTMYTGDRIIVNRVPMTAAAVSGKTYTPQRGQVIVFKNPLYQPGMEDEYIVKRVIGLSGERVVVQNCDVTVYNDEHPDGFNPYEKFDVSDNELCVSGDVDRIVPDGEIFVIGDHRNGQYSFDSRNGLSTVPLGDVVGPVGFRLFPLNKIRTF